MNKKILSLLTILALFSGTKAWGNTITVTAGSTDELSATPDGSCSLSEAVYNTNYNNATYGDCAEGEDDVTDQIIIPAGTYFVKSQGIVDDLEVIGAGNSSTTGTTLDASGASYTFYAYSGNLTLTKLRITGAGVNVRIVDLTIKQSTITGASTGVRFSGSHFILEDSIISQNTSYGLVIQDPSTVTITRSYLIDNGDSGIIYSIYYADTISQLSIESSFISGNGGVGIYVSTTADFYSGESAAVSIPKIAIQSSEVKNNLGGFRLGLSVFSDYLKPEDIDFNIYFGATVLADYFSASSDSAIAENGSSNCSIFTDYYDGTTEIENFDLSLTEENSQLTLSGDCVFVLDSNPTGGGSGSGGSSGSGDPVPDPDSGDSSGGGGCSLVVE